MAKATDRLRTAPTWSAPIAQCSCGATNVQPLALGVIHAGTSMVSSDADDACGPRLLTVNEALTVVDVGNGVVGAAVIVSFRSVSTWYSAMPPPTTVARIFVGSAGSNTACNSETSVPGIGGMAVDSQVMPASTLRQKPFCTPPNTQIVVGTTGSISTALAFHKRPAGCGSTCGFQVVPLSNVW